MATLKQLRMRINSVTSTQKITKAMQMVAASKLRRAQAAAEAARPYAERMERMLGEIAESMAGREDAPGLLAGSGADRVHLLVVTCSDRGLCGGFNGQVVRAVRARITSLRNDGNEVKLLCLGRKGRDQLKREHGGLIVDTIQEIDKGGLYFDKATPIAERLAAMFDDGAFDVCTIVYNHFKSVMSQVVTIQQLIPYGGSGESVEREAAADGVRAIYEYEPDEEEILAELLPRNLAVQVYRALLESSASEQAARMTAMDNATRNASDMIDSLTLHYNRTRQAAITKELIEIVTGAEAL
ncbi:MAG: F0F1 ATP synthase subunit gamma [Proteobacteria bacterium]|nr:F0F1 ATP synthase subunit gamma [Pseudomonadota bacterium]